MGGFIGGVVEKLGFGAEPSSGGADASRADVKTMADKISAEADAYGKSQQGKLGFLDTLSQGYANNQYADSIANSGRAASEWDKFSKTFSPIQERIATDANNIDSVDNQNRVAADATQRVQQNVDAARGQNARRLASMGINPNSGRAVAMDTMTDMDAAAMKSAAATGAIQDLKDRGVTQRLNAAQFGNTVADNALKIGNAASSSGMNSINAANAPINAANSVQGTVNSAKSSAMSGLSGVMNSENAKYEAEQARRSDKQGAVLGTIGSVVGMKMFSSKKAKEGKVASDDETTLAKIKKIPVQSWKYKKGVADEGRHIGAYAEDVHKQFGDEAAPKGKAIDIISMHGITLSAVRGLAKQVDRLQSQVTQLQK